MNLIELNTKKMGILHRKEFHNLNCSTIIIVRAIEGNVRGVGGKRPYRILAKWRYNIKRICITVRECNGFMWFRTESCGGLFKIRQLIFAFNNLTSDHFRKQEVCPILSQTCFPTCFIILLRKIAYHELFGFIETQICNMRKEIFEK